MTLVLSHGKSVTFGQFEGEIAASSSCILHCKISPELASDTRWLVLPNLGNSQPSFFIAVADEDASRLPNYKKVQLDRPGCPHRVVHTGLP